MVGQIRGALKGGGTEKRGGDTKILKRQGGGWGGAAESRGGCLKKEGAGGFHLTDKIH